MGQEPLTYESIQKECASRGMLSTPINGMFFLMLTNIHGFNRDEVIGVCLDVHSGYTIKMAVEQAKKQKQIRIELENQNA